MENNRSSLRRPDHRMRPINDKGKFFSIRQWLNGIFMLGALVGVFVYVFAENQNIGIYIILVSMAIKIIETVLRMMK